MTVCIIRRGELSDAEALAAFGARTFREAFGPANSLHNIEQYLRTTYGAPIQAAELADPRVITLVAVDAEGGLTAYAQLRPDREVPGGLATGAIELWRFYVDRPWHGQGLATQLMRAVRGEAVALKFETIWLAVWEHNPRAIGFYHREGFRQVGSQPFQLGDDLQTDLVMQSTLAAVEA